MSNIRDIFLTSAMGLASLLVGCGTAPKAPQPYGQNFDLAVTDASVEPQNPTTDTPVTLYFTVTNKGPDRAPSSRFILHRAVGSGAEAQRDPYFRIIDVSPLDSGAARTITLVLGGEPAGETTTTAFVWAYNSAGDRKWDTNTKDDSVRLHYVVIPAEK